MKRLVFLLGLSLAFPVFSQEAVSLETPPVDDSGRPSPNVVKTALERQGVEGGMDADDPSWQRGLDPGAMQG